MSHKASNKTTRRLSRLVGFGVKAVWVIVGVVSISQLLVSCTSSKVLVAKKEMRSLVTTEGATLSVPQGADLLAKSIKLRKVEKNRLTTFYTETVMGAGAGPAVGWSIEIETEKEIKAPMNLSIYVPSGFTKELGSKYKPVLFYYYPYNSEKESLEWVGSIPIFFDKRSHLIQATIDSSKFWEYFQKHDQKYLMSLIVGSELIRKETP